NVVSTGVRGSVAGMQRLAFAFLATFALPAGVNDAEQSVTDTAPLVSAPNSNAAVRAQWDLTARAIAGDDAPGGADVTMTGFLEPTRASSSAPTTDEVRAFVAARLPEIFGDMSGAIGRVELSREGAFDDVAGRFTGPAILGMGGLFAMTRWAGVAS